MTSRSALRLMTTAACLTALLGGMAEAQTKSKARPRPKAAKPRILEEPSTAVTVTKARTMIAK